MSKTIRKDVAIVGGGAVGLSIARELTNKAVDVAVIDASHEIPLATYAAAGMLAPSFESDLENDLGEALLRFSVESLERWNGFANSLEKETGRSIDFQPNGMFGVAMDDDEAAALHDQAEHLARRGLEIDLLSGEAARKMEPALSGAITHAVFAPKDGQVHARLLLEALRKVARRTTLMISDRAMSIRKEGNRLTVSLASGGFISADKIVVASGAAASVCDGAPAPPVFPVHGEALALDCPAPVLGHVVRANGAYLCPKSTGRMVIGATETPGRADHDVDDRAIARLREKAGAVVPALGCLVETDRWSGLRPGTPDKAPILGADPRGIDGVYFALGHYRNGILLTPLTAAAIAAEVMGAAAVTDLKPFRPDRFD